MHPHSEIIDNVGTKAIRQVGVTDQQIYNWRRRGISWRFRYAISEIAEARGVSLPVGFLTSQSGKELPDQNIILPNSPIKIPLLNHPAGRGIDPVKHDHMVKMLAHQPTLSNVMIAKLCGLGEGYVRKHRKLFAESQPEVAR